MPAATARPMTPIHRPGRLSTWVGQPGRRARAENWWAVSVDGTWAYERLEMAGTPWEIIHTPTQATLPATSLRDARRFTAARALEQIRGDARRVIERRGDDGGLRLALARSLGREDRAADIAVAAASARMRRARAVLAILDGAMLPAGRDDAVPQAVCACAGMLARTDAGWSHVDCCPACWSAADGWRRGGGAFDLPWCPADSARRGHMVCDEIEVTRRW